MVQILVKNIKEVDTSNGLFVIGIYEDKTDMDYLQASGSYNIFKKISVKDIANLEQIKKFGKTMILYYKDGETVLKFLLLGLGKTNELDNDKFRQLGGIISLKAKELNLSKVIIPNFFKNQSDVEALTEGLYLSLYNFNKYKDDEEKNTASDFFKNYSVFLLSDDETSSLSKIVEKTLQISESVFYTRDLANSPPNEINPQELANSAMSLEKSSKIKVKILDKNQIESAGLNGIISVGMGSKNEPKLIIIEYNHTSNDEKPILLVGKAVTFDTGGISIKPSDKMDEMKFDKSGGCTVLGIMKALSTLDLPIKVVAIVPSVENMPSSSSYRPGDIIKMYNGKTVEVLNTDAEGRLILADALAYGVENYSPRYIIDFATLTGACIIALGSNVAGIMGNDEKFIKNIIQKSSESGEKIWQLPLYTEYFDLIKSNVANIKNIGGRTGGAITAAAFLSHFVDDVPWAHIDIAGTAWTQDGTIEKSYNPKGSTGFGVRTIIKLLEKNP